jgi:cyclic pyranopterin monophosphate synthase
MPLGIIRKTVIQWTNFSINTNYAIRFEMNHQHLIEDKKIRMAFGGERHNFAHMRDELTHIDEKGRITMVNVGEKPTTHRRAVAEGRVFLPDEICKTLENNELQSAKGPVFQTAMLAGIMAAKKTGELIPLCHPLGLDQVEVFIAMEGNEAIIRGAASVHAKTGVEMEALTAVSIAALTIYDMCKAMSHHIEIRSIKLIEKSGGKRDFKR